MGARRVAPPAVVAGQRPVGRAEVGGGDRDAGLAPPRVRPLAVARDLVALPARRAVVVEQGRTPRSTGTQKIGPVRP
jgi:hypothetical protein